MKKLLVTYCDREGKPRAWATGPIEQREAVCRRAFVELRAYVRKRAEVGEVYVVGDFERHEEPFDETT